jgi:hypothetical protein
MEGLRRVASTPKRQSAPSSQRLINSRHGLVSTDMYLLAKQSCAKHNFEGDLGLTGDDGTDLLTATEKRFDVTFDDSETGIPETFDLRPNEYLFNSEG